MVFSKHSFGNEGHAQNSAGHPSPKYLNASNPFTPSSTPFRHPSPTSPFLSSHVSRSGLLLWFTAARCKLGNKDSHRYVEEERDAFMWRGRSFESEGSNSRGRRFDTDVVHVLLYHAVAYQPWY
ncbi:hypothetical protein EYF80_046705 [Liparis tanakae]|uniref:Uncharacterized protein n=1 Tax=Liparis tanakae TaxID=230148 RepID=A0A4Z2FPE3_9TELE|nr:hypothetical protein EYF80_046705 [Liparis tanakae]